MFHLVTLGAEILFCIDLDSLLFFLTHFINIKKTVVIYFYKQFFCYYAKMTILHSLPSYNWCLLRSIFLWKGSNINTHPFFSSVHYVYRALSLAPEEGQGRFTDCTGHCAGNIKHCCSQRPQLQDWAPLWMKYYTRPALIKSASTQNYT